MKSGNYNWLAIAAAILAGSVALNAQNADAPAAQTPQAAVGQVPNSPGDGTPGAEAGRGRGGRGFPPPTHGLGMNAVGRVLEPAYDTTPPELPADLKPGGLLIYSKTNGFRDEPAIQASDAALAAIAKMRGLPYFVTENGAIMNSEQLSEFKLVIWNNNSGNQML